MMVLNHRSVIVGRDPAAPATAKNTVISMVRADGDAWARPGHDDADASFARDQNRCVMGGSLVRSGFPCQHGGYVAGGGRFVFILPHESGMIALT